MKEFLRFLRLHALGLALVCIASPALAAQDLAAMCENVSVEVARRTGVPVSVLKAISLNETGRRREGTFRPWPWTVNMEGAGHWFDSYPEARSYVEQEYQRGARSFDIGCFQINYKWHGQEFASIDEMFDPLANGLYAARFLTDLYNETGSWTKAAGAFHSRTPEHATQYAARFEGFRNKFLGEDNLLMASAPMIGGQPGYLPVGNATTPARYVGGQYMRPQRAPLGQYANVPQQQFQDPYQTQGADAPLSAMRVQPQFVPQGQMAADNIPEIPDIVAAMYGEEIPALPPAPRVNNFPLLQAGSGGGTASPGRGSLVPSVANTGGSLFAQSAKPLVE
jgi:hypothetical protein